MANNCKELGCSACCGETNLTQRIPIDDVTYQLLVEGSRVLQVESKSFMGYAIAADLEKGKHDVIAASITNPADGSLWWLVQLVGNCPQLSEEGECKIYENRPVSCRAFPDPYGKTIGGQVCDGIRVARGMEPFDQS